MEEVKDEYRVLCIDQINTCASLLIHAQLAQLEKTHRHLFCKPLHINTIGLNPAARFANFCAPETIRTIASKVGVDLEKHKARWIGDIYQDLKMYDLFLVSSESEHQRIIRYPNVNKKNVKTVCGPNGIILPPHNDHAAYEHVCTQISTWLYTLLPLQ